MAKTASKAMARTGKAKPATKPRRAPVKTRAAHGAETHVDGCDLEFDENDATPDAQLPAAKGGVALPGGKGSRRS